MTDAKFPSYYEMLTDKLTIRKTKMLGWMEANFDTRLLWNVRLGTNASANQSAGVDVGLHLLTGITSDVFSIIDENDIRHFNEVASFVIGVIQTNNNTGAIERLGLAEVTTLAGYQNAANFAGYQADTNFSLETDNAGTTSRTATTTPIAMDTIFHTVQVECGASNILLSMAGVLEVTKSTDRPSANLQVFSSIMNGVGGSNCQTMIRYIEAANV